MNAVRKRIGADRAAFVGHGRISSAANETVAFLPILGYKFQMDERWDADLRHAEEVAQLLRGRAAELKIIAQEVRARSRAALASSDALHRRRIELRRIVAMNAGDQSAE